MAGLGRAYAVALVGTAGHLVDVEAHTTTGLPAFTIVGLPDAAVSEARERVRAALASSGVPWSPSRTTVNLSPASLHKHGTALDLALAVAVLRAGGLAEDREPTVHLGELALDGTIQPVRGALPALLAARTAGIARAVVPEGNLAEALLVPCLEVVGHAHLADVVTSLGGDAVRPRATRRHAARARSAPPPAPEPDLADVLGQDDARRALEVAAAGGHHLLLVGPPGAGKSMLAARLPSLLPDLDDAEAMEVTAVHSLAGTFGGASLVRRPPFESPHHTASGVSIVGGGPGMPRPGAASRAHRGVLLLDEAPEFRSSVLETLRQPLENGEISIHRAGGRATFPARFQLVLTANPCPCGFALDPGGRCSCSSLARRSYLTRLSGPLVDRVDLQVTVAPVSRAELALAAPAEASALVARRVAAARAASHRRLRGTRFRTNAEVSGAWMRSEDSGTPPDVLSAAARAVDRGALSLRGMDRVLRVAWTLADLAGERAPTMRELGEALALRTNGVARA